MAGGQWQGEEDTVARAAAFTPGIRHGLLARPGNEAQCNAWGSWTVRGGGKAVHGRQDLQRADTDGELQHRTAMASVVVPKGRVEDQEERPGQVPGVGRTTPHEGRLQHGGKLLSRHLRTAVLL